MARTKFLNPAILCAAITGLAALTGCSPSPLYVDRAQVGTFGEVPRDGRGEPIWTAIPPAQVQQVPEAMPQPGPGTASSPAPSPN